MQEEQIREALNAHWAASDADDFETEHLIYHEDAVLDYPQSGERTRGRRNIQNQRASQPSKKRFTVKRIIGGGDLWVTEFILTYDGKPSYTVSIMEFRNGKVVHETQYFADPFDQVRAPGGRRERIRKILRFARHLVARELHDAHRIGRLAVIGQDEFSNPKITTANDSLDSKPLFVRLTSALVLYVATTAHSLA